MSVGLGADTSPPFDEGSVNIDVSSDASIDHRAEESIVETNVGIGEVGDSSS